MSLPRDLRERILSECGVAALEAKVAALAAKADAAEARLASAEKALADLAVGEYERRVTALEASLGVFEAEDEVRR